ncbi:hypothetical protein DXT87_17450 [Arthrobacter sp. AET 35A]|nr:hypothetical protein [Arthrobacter sp. AET 35A]
MEGRPYDLRRGVRSTRWATNKPQERIRCISSAPPLIQGSLSTPALQQRRARALVRKVAVQLRGVATLDGDGP